MTEQLTWGTVPLVFAWSAGAPVRLVAVDGRAVHQVPVADVLTAGAGRTPASDRLAHTTIGARLRYVSHDIQTDGARSVLRIRQCADGLTVDSVFECRQDVPALRAHAEATNTGAAPIVLRAIASWVGGFTSEGSDDDPLAGWRLTSGRSDWLAEGRWCRESLRGAVLPPLAQELTGHNPRGSLAHTSTGTWSTGASLPTGVLDHPGQRAAVAWQIEHNGAWRWEVGEDTGGAYLALGGPTDADSAWTKVLNPRESFASVPVSAAFGTDRDSAVAAITAHRRASRRMHPDNEAMPVVFNDYMNTLDGDPTTDRLLPLIAAAADVGSEIFCIDAGWYDDTGDWWDGVGEWAPSTGRFPSGIGEVVDAIRDAGMVPGLWLEPEVIGVQSLMATRLPEAAFLQRHGQRIVEHGRYHLDLRHPAAIAHLDEVVDRLVQDLGVGYFKLDYNIDPGPGTDVAADSVGDGLLSHNRAHLAWLDGVLDRHPALVLENCGSGAMRMDAARLSRLQLQSTSDQQNFTKYPPIAASAPMSMPPEQAASWAYPQPEMSPEEASFCLATGLLGRFYVSGYLNRMASAQRERVATAVRLAKSLRERIRSGLPYWPLGLPDWNAEVVALGSKSDADDLVTIWSRGPGRAVELAAPHLRGREVRVETLFPLDLPRWHTDWDRERGCLRVQTGEAAVAARLLRLIPLHDTDETD